MSNENKMKSIKNSKKEDGKFHSKHIKHNPQDESARSTFGVTSTHVENKKWLPLSYILK